MADTIGDGYRWVEGDGIARNRGYLLDFIGRPVAIAKSAPCSVRLIRITGEIVPAPRRIALLPYYPIIRRGPNLPEPLYVCPPASARSLIQQDPAVLATLTEFVPATASAVRVVAVVLLFHRIKPTIITGEALPPGW